MMIDFKVKYLALFLTMFLVFTATGQHIKAMSYNIKYDNQGDSLNNWLDRRPIW